MLSHTLLTHDNTVTRLLYNIIITIIIIHQMVLSQPITLLSDLSMWLPGQRWALCHTQNVTCDSPMTHDQWANGVTVWQGVGQEQEAGALAQFRVTSCSCPLCPVSSAELRPATSLPADRDCGTMGRRAFLWPYLPRQRSLSSVPVPYHKGKFLCVPLHYSHHIGFV